MARAGPCSTCQMGNMRDVECGGMLFKINKKHEFQIYRRFQKKRTARDEGVQVGAIACGGTQVSHGQSRSGSLRAQLLAHSAIWFSTAAAVEAERRLGAHSSAQCALLRGSHRHRLHGRV